jgi:ERCC4-related helicase
MQANTPVARLVSRHTRELLRKYYEAGKISSRIAIRLVEDEFVTLTQAERTLYEAVEDYIDTASQLEQEALKKEEVLELELLRDRISQLPTDTKAKILLKKIQQLQAQGYRQIIIFTQYTDTMDFLRKFLLQSDQQSLICFSGRGGEIPSSDRSWRKISRDATKRLFREVKADILRRS